MSQEDAGLRERKKTAAMRRIQNAALDLFDERGYDTVTVEEIAEASEVSPSSIYRYFGTKEQIVLWDEYDPAMLAQLRNELAGTRPMEAAHRVMETMVAGFGAGDEERSRRRTRHIMADPTLEAAFAGEAYALSEMLGELLAERLGRPAEDLEVQVFSHAIIGGLLGAVHHWHGAGFREPLADVLERSFAIFADGLDVGRTSGS